MLSHIGPNEAKRLLDEGAVLIDVRGGDERAREHIPQSRHVPLSTLAKADLGLRDGQAVLFHCKSGMRTAANAPLLAAKVGGACEAYIVEGGLEAWRNAGLPVVTDRSQPLELQRQVQIAAGGLAFFGTLLGLLVSPWFFVVPFFVGAGLMVAGATGFCGMARFLVHAPWNRALNAPVEGRPAARA